MNRRGFVSGLLAMPAIIRTPGLLMAIKPVAPWVLRNQSPAEWLEDMIRERLDELLGITYTPKSVWMTHWQFMGGEHSDYVLR